MENNLFGYQPWFQSWLKECGYSLDSSIQRENDVLLSYNREKNCRAFFDSCEKNGVDVHTPLSKFADDSWTHWDRDPFRYFNAGQIRKDATYSMIKVYRDSYIKVARCPMVDRNFEERREVKRDILLKRKERDLEIERNYKENRMIRFDEHIFRFGLPKLSKKVDDRVFAVDVIAHEMDKLDEYSELSERFESLEYEKERCNLSRASSTILELAMCNDWQWFATFTVKKELMDRYDLPSLNRKFSLMIRDLNEKFKCEIRYLSVPEAHKDGAWHLHVMMMGVPDMLLKDFHMKSKIKVKLKKYIAQGQRVARIPLFDNSIGASTLIQIKDSDEDRIKVALYFKKYVTKDVRRLCNEKHKRLFYSSHGLKRASRVYKGGMILENKLDYVKVVQSSSSTRFDVLPSLSEKNENKTIARMRIFNMIKSRCKTCGVDRLTPAKMEPMKFVSYKKWCSWRSRKHFKDKPLGRVGAWKIPLPPSAIIYESSILKSPLELFNFCCSNWRNGEEFGERPNLDKLKDYLKEKGVIVRV